VALAALVGVALVVKLVPGIGDRVLGTKDAATASAPSSAPPPDSAAATPSATASAVPSAVASSAPSVSPSAPPPERPTIVDGFDGAGWREQLRKAVKWSDGKMATQAVLALCAIDPQSLTERALLKDVAQALVQAALGDAAAADEVFARLGAEDTGSAGPDVLYQLVVSHAGTKAAERANGLLARPEILARATPAMRAALDLNRASCADKPQHFEAVAKDGDHRSLMQLLDLRPPRCNDLGSGCCLGHDPRYRDALNALGSRVTGN
jgi:serine/threonine-protein kinase